LSSLKRHQADADDNVQGYWKTSNQEQDAENPTCSKPIVKELANAKCHSNDDHGGKASHTTNLANETSNPCSLVKLLVVLGHLSLVLVELVHYITTSMCDNSHG